MTVRCILLHRPNRPASRFRHASADHPFTDTLLALSDRYSWSPRPLSGQLLFICWCCHNKYIEDEERKLLNRLYKYKENYFAWVRNFSLPTTNNLSERSLRGIKTKGKVSGQFLSEMNARYFARIRSYTETCYRSGISPYQALVRLMMGNPYTVEGLLNKKE